MGIGAHPWMQAVVIEGRLNLRRAQQAVELLLAVVHHTQRTDDAGALRVLQHAPLRLDDVAIRRFSEHPHINFLDAQNLAVLL